MVLSDTPQPHPRPAGRGPAPPPTAPMSVPCRTVLCWLAVGSGVALAAGTGVLAGRAFPTAALPFVLPVLFLSAVVFLAVARDNARRARLLCELRAQTDRLRLLE